MIAYRPVTRRPMMAQTYGSLFPTSELIELTYSEVKGIKDGLDRAMNVILANTSAPCVARLDRRELDSVQSLLFEMVYGARRDYGVYSLRREELDVIDQAIRCGDELSGGSVIASADVSLAPLVIPALLVAASVGVSAYHGYKRNNSTGWAVWWGLMGALFPIITPVVALVQGYGKREK